MENEDSRRIMDLTVDELVRVLIDENIIKGDRGGILNVKDVAIYIGVSKQTIYNWIAQKEIPYHRLGNKYLFMQSEIYSIFENDEDTEIE